MRRRRRSRAIPPVIVTRTRVVALLEEVEGLAEVHHAANHRDGRGQRVLLRRTFRAVRAVLVAQPARRVVLEADCRASERGTERDVTPRDFGRPLSFATLAAKRELASRQSRTTLSKSLNLVLRAHWRPRRTSHARGSRRETGRPSETAAGVPSFPSRTGASPDLAGSTHPPTR